MTKYRFVVQSELCVSWWKYRQEWTTSANQDKHIPLRKCHYAQQILDGISIQYFW